MEVQKCHTFGRLGISCFGKAGFFFPPPELIWGYQYTRGLWNIIFFSGQLSDWQIITSMHICTALCITIHYHSCSIDNYRNVKDVKCQNFGRLGISHLEKEGLLQNSLQKLEEFPPHSFSHLSWFEVLLCYASEMSSIFHRELSNWQIITSIHMGCIA